MHSQKRATVVLRLDNSKWEKNDYKRRPHGPRPQPGENTTALQVERKSPVVVYSNSSLPVCVKLRFNAQFAESPLKKDCWHQLLSAVLSVNYRRETAAGQPGKKALLK